MPAAKHLWEVHHAYYCNNGNYFNNDCGHEYKSWHEFLDEMGDADMNYNLLFRWDWEEGEDHGLAEYNGDDNYRHAKFNLYFMGQRKGLFTYSIVDVCRADEPAILEYLAPRWRYINSLWEPCGIQGTDMDKESIGA